MPSSPSSAHRYPSDLTDDQWALIEPLLAPCEHRRVLGDGFSEDGATLDVATSGTHGLLVPPSPAAC